MVNEYYHRAWCSDSMMESEEPILFLSLENGSEHQEYISQETLNKAVIGIQGERIYDSLPCGNWIHSQYLTEDGMLISIGCHKQRNDFQFIQMVGYDIQKMINCARKMSLPVYALEGIVQER